MRTRTRFRTRNSRRSTASAQTWNPGLLDPLVWFDASRSTGSQTISNLGSAGSSYGAIVGSQPASDSNDPTLLSWSGENYLYLPGTTSNYASVPDAAALDITGDLSMVADIVAADWTPAATFRIGGKEGAYVWTINTSGNMVFTFVDAGAVVRTITSTVALGFIDGVDRKQVGVSYVAGTGVNDVRFWTRSNSSEQWIQVGTTLSSSGTSIIASTGAVAIGATETGLSPIAGRYYRFTIYGGVGVGNTPAISSPILDVDFTTGITSGGQTSFTATTGQTVTINRSTTGRKAVAVVRPVWLFGTDDYMQVPADPDGAYVTLNGTSQYVSCPDAAGLDVTGDIEIVCRVAMTDWTPSSISSLIGKWGGGTQRSFYLGVLTDGKMRLIWTPDGTFASRREVVSTVALPATDGTTYWVKATLDVDNGAAGHTVSFYYAADQPAEPSSWTQLGTSVVTAGVSSIFAGTDILEIGSVVSGSTLHSAGKFYRAIVRNGIGGTIVADWQACGHPANREAYYDAYSNLWSMTGSPTLSNPNRLNFALGDSFTVLAVIRHWANPPSFVRILSKGSNTLNASFHLFNHNANGKVYFAIASATGVGANTAGGVPTYSMGQSVVLTGIRNTATDKLGSYFNTTDYGTSPTDSTTGAIASAAPFTIAQSNDMELLAVAVFSKALSTDDITQICRYYQTI